MEQRVISNKVYSSLQAPTNYHQETTGKILYANSFSGVSPVAMPDDLKALINSDLGLIGNNILIQLEQKMRGYGNGPWYVDSRDGVIYIHNRKFKESPEHSYIYQFENGEVLRVSFSTQKVTKRSKVQLSETIDPDDKGMISNTTQIVEPKETPNEPKEELGINQVDNTMVRNYGSDNVEDYRSFPTTNWKAEWEARNKPNNFVTTGKGKDTKVKELSSMTPGQSFNHNKEEKLKSLSTEQYRDIINEVAGKLPNDRKRLLDKVIRNSKTGKVLEANLKKFFEIEKYVFKEDQQVEYLADEYIDPVEYDPQGYSIKSGRAMGGLEYKTSYSNAWDRGYEAMKTHPQIVEITGDSKTYNLGYGNMGRKIRVRRMKKHDYEVPLSKLYHNLFSRYGGADKYAWAVNANANGGLKITERKLVCQMTVIGRPSLASSQVIYLGNVGKRWSGYWYIKSVQHSMDAGQGYLCTLDLIRSNSMEGTSTTKTQLSTQDIVSNDAKDTAKTNFGKDKTNSSNASSILHDFTDNEVVYYVERFLDKNGKMIDAKGASEFLQNKFIYDEVNAGNPEALAMGTVRTTGNKVGSDGSVKYGKTTVVQVEAKTFAEHKKIAALKKKYDFDWSNWSLKLYKNYKNNKIR